MGLFFIVATLLTLFFAVMIGVLVLMVVVGVVKNFGAGNRNGSSRGILAGLEKFARGRAGGTERFSPVPARRARLLTPTEERFFKVLRLALPPGTHLLAKVRLRDLFDFNERSKEGWRLHSRCAQKHADFVIVSERDHLPLVVIELDDWTHGRARSQKSDGVKDGMWAHAGLPLLRVGVSPSYNEAAIDLRIREAIATVGAA